MSQDDEAQEMDVDAACGNEVEESGKCAAFWHC